MSNLTPIIILLLLTSCDPSKKKCPPNCPPPPISPKKIQQKIDSINKKLKYLVVEESPDVFIEGEPQDSVIKYKIHTKESTKKPISGMYFFEVNKYHELKIRNPTSFPSKELCKVFRGLGTFDTPLLDAIQAIQVDTKVSLWKGEIELKDVEKLLLELLYSLFEMEKIKARKIRILIRGYADLIKGTVKDPYKLANKPHDYQSIPFKPITPHKRGKVSAYYYESKDSILNIINNKFGNDELPLLRAHFIKDDIIDSTLYHCRGVNARVAIDVLEGKVFKKRNDKDLRKVDIYVHFYFDKSP